MELATVVTRGAHLPITRTDDLSVNRTLGETKPIHQIAPKMKRFPIGATLSNERRYAGKTDALSNEALRLGRSPLVVDACAHCVLVDEVSASDRAEAER